MPLAKIKESMKYGQVKVTEGAVPTVEIAVENKRGDVYMMFAPDESSCYQAALEDYHRGTLDTVNYCFFLDSFTEDYTGEIRYVVT